MRYLIAARVSPKGSTWDQNETSIGTQIEVCREYIAREDQKATVVDVLVEEFVSGGNVKARPKMLSLLEQVKAGQADWDVLVCYNQMRHSRNLLDTLNIQQTLSEFGKHFVSVCDGIDTRRDRWNAEEMIQLKGFMAEAERRRIRRQVTDKMRRIAMAGEWSPGVPPYGYMRSGVKHDNVLRIHPEQAPIVKAVFADRVNGMSLNAIARKYELTRSLARKIMSNRVYCGKIVYRDGTIYDGKHEALISDKTFETVQKSFPSQNGGRQVVKKTSSATKYTYLFSGLLKCHCGNCLTPASSQGRNKKLYHYYVCTNVLECKTRFPAPKLDRYLLEHIRRTELHKEDIDSAVENIRRIGKEQLANASPELERIRSERRKGQEEVERITGLFLSGAVTADNAQYFNDILKAAREEVEKLDERKQAAEEIIQDGAKVYEKAEQMARNLSVIGDLITAAGDDPQELRPIIYKYVHDVQCTKRQFVINLIPTGRTVASIGSQWLPSEYQNATNMVALILANRRLLKCPA